MERKKAIEIIRKLYNESLFLKKDKEAMVTLIPELAESEDEEIRKFLIQMAQNGHGEDRDWWNKCVAWLEKQQKPIASSKFKVGDKVVHKGTGKLWTVHWYIKEDNVYSVKDSEGLIHIYSPDVLELIEQKPAEWSEEDERDFDDIRDIIYNSCNAEDASRLIAWLKAIKDRVVPQPQQESTTPKLKT
jgi:hypothetical protein